MNREKQLLIQRLKEGDLSLRRFLKVDDTKRAFEKEWQNKLYTPEELENYHSWGICGGSGLVLIDADSEKMEKILRRVLPPTFEVLSSRRKLPHFYLKVDGDVQNKTLYIPEKNKASGEIRVNNQYLVAAGTTTHHGIYKIIADRPIATLTYKAFMDAITPFLGKNSTQKLTEAQIKEGVSKGERHSVGIKYANFLIGVQGLDYAAALVEMLRWNKMCVPPNSEAEVKRMVVDAVNHQKNKPKPKQKPEKTSQFFDKKGKFEPVTFAKHLLKKHHFKTMRDNRTIYVYDKKKGIYTPDGETLIQSEMAALLDEESKKTYINDVQFYIEAVTFFDRPNSPSKYIATLNGLLDPITSEFVDFTPDEFVETKIPIFYNPKEDSPDEIIQFIMDVVGKENPPSIQELSGYLLLKGYPIHRAFMFVGSGSNGKSTLMRLFTKLIGKENKSDLSLHSLCNNRFAKAVLYNKLGNFCPDLPNKVLTNTGIFKSLVGEDSIMAEEKYKNPFSFTNHAKLVFSANKVPDSQDDTTAFYRRWIIIHCNNTYSPKGMGGAKRANPHILDDICNIYSMSGFLNWALEGLKRLLKNGRFSQKTTWIEQRADYIKHSNSAKAFIESQLEESSDHEDFIPYDELYSAYAKWCKDEKLSSMVKAKFTENLTQHLPTVAEGFKTETGKAKIRVWRYLRFRSGSSGSSGREGRNPYLSEFSVEEGYRGEPPEPPEDVIDGYFKPKKLPSLETPKKEFCSDCGRELEADEFRTHLKGKLLCKSCFRKERQQDDNKNREGEGS